MWGTAFHPDGEHLASTSLGGQALEWDVSHAGALGDRAVWVGGNVGQFFLGADPDQVLAGVVGKNVRLIGVSTGAMLTDLGIPDEYVFEPTENLDLVAGYAADELGESGIIVDSSTGDRVQTFDSCQLPAAVSPDETMVAVGPLGPHCQSEPSRLLSSASGETLLDFGPKPLLQALFSPSGWDVDPYLVVNLDFEAIEVFRVDPLERVARLTAKDLRVPFFLALDVDPEGHYLGIGNQSGRVLVLDMDEVMSGDRDATQVILDFDSHKTSIPQVRVSRDGLAVSVGFDGFYRVWNISTGELLFEIREPDLIRHGAAQFTWDGKQLAYEDALGNIRFTPIDTYEVVKQAKAVLTRTLTDDECRQYLHIDGCEA